MWTTAGAIFSTTSAMKLNLYRGLVSWWRPALAGRTRCISEAPEPPPRRKLPQGPHRARRPSAMPQTQQHSDTQTFGRGLLCPKNGEC